jgi:hypothetical protein
MTEDLKPIAFAASSSHAQGFQRAISLESSVDDVARRLKQCIEAEDVWVLHEVNPQMLLERGGYAILGLAEGRSELRWIDPRLCFDRYQSPQLAELGRELFELCERIAEAVIG